MIKLFGSNDEINMKTYLYKGGCLKTSKRNLFWGNVLQKRTDLNKLLYFIFYKRCHST